MLPLVTDFSTYVEKKIIASADIHPSLRSLVEVGGIVQRVGGDPPLNGTLPKQAEMVQTTISTSLDNNITKLAVSSIDNDENRRKNVKIWTFKQKRAYHRVLSGYRFSIFLSKPLRFFTLTTAIGVKRNINDDFQILKKRIGRKFGHLEYFKVKSSEGNGVLHVIYRGPYIPQKWLSRHWNDIRGSPIVDY